MATTRCFRLLALFVSIGVLCCFSAFGEDAGRVRIRFDDYKDPVLLLRNYVELSKSSPASGDIDRDSYLVKGMMYYLLDQIDRDCGTNKLEEYTFETFRTRYTAVLEPFAGLKDICPDADKVLKAVLAAGMLGYFWPVTDDRTKEANLAREFADSLMAGPDFDKSSHIVKLACGLLRGTGPMAFGDVTRGEGPAAMFVLNSFVENRIIPKIEPGIRKDPEWLDLGISPLTDKRWTADRMADKVKAQGIFHPYTVFTMTPPTMLVDLYIPDDGSEGWNHPRGGWVNVAGYARGPVLLHSYYCDKIRKGAGPPCALDIEGIYVDEELSLSASIQGDDPGRETRGTFYPQLLMRVDHLERSAPWSGANSSQREVAQKKYAERLKLYRPYLAARYSRTIKTSVTMTKTETMKATMEYLTPDYSCKPEFFVAMVPDEWIRIACYCGLEAVADFNIFGLDDPRPVRPKE